MSEVVFASECVGKDGIKADLSKLTAVINWTTLTTIQNLSSSLALTGYFRPSIKNYSLLEKPLKDLFNTLEVLKLGDKGAYHNATCVHLLWDQWMAEHAKAFEKSTRKFTGAQRAQVWWFILHCHIWWLKRWLCWGSYPMFSMDFIMWHYPYTSPSYFCCFQMHIWLRITLQTILAGVCCTKVQFGQILQHYSQLGQDRLPGSSRYYFEQQAECNSCLMVRWDYGPQYCWHMTPPRLLEPSCWWH